MSDTPSDDEDTPPWEPTSHRLRKEAEALSAKLDDSLSSDYKVFKALQKAGRAENLEAAEERDDGGWTKHTPWHWSRYVGERNGWLLNYWPTTNKAQFMDRMYYGRRAVQDLFTKLGIP